MKRVSCLLVVALAGGALAPSAAARARADPMGMLEQADANRDGSVTRAELLAARRARFAQMDRNDDGYFSIDDIPRVARKRASDRIGQLTSRFDANRDGRLSRGEFVDGPTHLFDLGDRDGSGSLEPGEIARMRSMAAQRD